MQSNPLSSSQQVLLALREARKKIEGLEYRQREPIAIVGIGCRFPGPAGFPANTPAQFWELLRSGRDCVREVPPAHHPDAMLGQTGARAAFLDQADHFDPGFFGISPREAKFMDPQQRLLLEVCWEAMEAAHLVPDQLFDSDTGVFVGLCTNDYADLILGSGAVTEADSFYAGTGTMMSIASGRISYTFGLQGPAVSVDTACSASLVAIHQACQSLRSRECTIALAAGVNLMFNPFGTNSPEAANGDGGQQMYAPDGRCKTFDAAADGYGRGEGCGVLVLKRLSDAQAAGDKIWAVIRGSMINHDGRSSGLTAPNGPAQQSVIRQALQSAGVDPAAVAYIEAHGTGTALGDPIEIGALTAVFGNRPTPLWVGSVKTNVGHLEGAAGVVALIKVALSMHHGEIPPHLNFHQPSPLIDWAATPIQIPLTPTPWPAAQPFAGISSFGLSGTNAHIILEKAPPDPRPAPAVEGVEPVTEPPLHLLTLSAKSEAALLAQAQQYHDFLAESADLPLVDLCYTAQVARSHFAHRLALAAGSVDQLREQLAAYLNGEQPAGLLQGPPAANVTAGAVAFLFTGQGAQYVNMGRELYATEPTFRAILDQCDALLQEELGESLLAVLYPETGDTRQGDTRHETRDTSLGGTHESRSTNHESRTTLDDTTYTQPALFVLEYALAKLWQAWGIQPNLLIGHSVGEVAAACVAGVFSLEDGLKLIAARGRLMGALPQDGAMVSLLADERRVQAAIAPYLGEVSIAAVNGPTSVVISGQRERVLAIAAQLAAEGVKSQQLTVSHAFHSPLMEPMLAAFEQVAASITYHEPQIGLIANVTGQLAGAEITTPAYWVRHVREAVRFSDGINTLLHQGIDICLEIGPKPVLLGMVAAIIGAQTTLTPSPPHPLTLPSLRANHSDWQTLLTSLGELYVQGATIDWGALHKGPEAQWARRKVTLPTYPFQRQRYWIDTANRAYGLHALGPLLDKMIQSPTLNQTLFETAINPLRLPFLQDHRVYGALVAPGACHLAMVLSAGALTLPQTSDTSAYQLTDVIFPEALALADGATRTAQIILTPAADHADTGVGFQLLSFDDAGTGVPSIHATGSLAVVDQVAPDDIVLSELQARFSEAVAFNLYHDETDTTLSPPIVFGPTFRWLDAVWRQPDQPGQVLGRLRRPAVVEQLADYLLHPGLLDACFQMTGLANQLDPLYAELYLPFALETLTLYPPAVGSDEEFWWSQVVQVDALKWDIRLFTNDGHLLALITGFTVRAAGQSALQAAQLRTDWLYTLAWTPTPLPMTTAAPLTLPDCWLILGEASGLDRQLIAQLQIDGRPVVWASAVTPVEPVQATHYTVDLTDGTAVRTIIADLTAQHQRLGVVYLGGVADDLGLEAIPTTTVTLCGGLLHLAQALAASTATTQLWVVTQDCQVVDQDAQPQPPSASLGFAAAAGSLWGLARTLAQEEPSLHVVCIDVDRLMAADHLAGLLHTEFMAGLRATAGAASQAEPLLDSQVVYLNGARYVAQLSPWQAPKPFAATQPMRLQLTDYGSLENLAFVPMTRRQPAPGEVEVAVKAVGLNFRDVLNALGMMKEYYAAALGITDPKAVGLGFECAGQVTAVGDGVTAFAVGDRVMGLAGAEGAFASYITVPADQLISIPDQLSDAEAATIPLTFLTAWYGLVELAKLQAGERVLIHAAAGGVGQAALQIAHALGAEVIATASPGKWDFLRGQGVAHVLNSRTLAFAEEIAQITGGRGVDVVLNSLNGDFIERTFAALAVGGRFVEIGKLGIWTPAEVAQQRPDVAYFPFDLGEAMYADPTLHATLWQAIREGLTDGTLRPLPQTTFPAQEIVAAFRYMQQAKQIGKVVVTFAEPQPLTIHADGTYLLTGGLGALGLQIAQQLVEDGARHLVLTGRQGITSDAQRAVLEQLAEAGANVQVIAADIGDAVEVKALLDRCSAIAPLRGIVHAAGLLDDGVLASQSVARLAKVMRPKVDGAWHLHTLTQELPLDFFVCFSSAAALTGSPGQSNYAAANAFLDSLMQQRRQAGLPGLSINWGAWAHGGMAAHLEKRSELATLITPQQGRLLFRYLLTQPNGQVGVMPLQRSATTAQASDRRAGQRTTLRATLAKVAPSERPARLEAYLCSEITAVLGLHANTAIDGRTRLFDFGLDSLMAVELRNKLEKQLGCSLRSTLIFDYPTLEVLVPYLYHEVLGELANDNAVVPTPAAVAHTATPATVDLAEPIAIVGMGCRYPGDVDSPQRFWESLVAGFDGIIDLPGQRLVDLYGQPSGMPGDAATAAMAAYALRGGFLTQVDRFDPAFFGLAPREVLVMDPAHRLLLETAWQALEAANIVPATLFNTEVGVFIGNGVSGYASLCAEVENNLYIATGNTASTASGRLSYLLGLTGPAVSIDTACSSSLTAIHLACQSLRQGECNAALAGGVNVILDAGFTAMFASGNMLSTDAHCKTFDATADGYVRGEGCGVIVLKRLADAQANGDTILAVIRGSAVNQDGPSGGLTVPNGPAQARVIRRALANANLQPAQIGYIEAHGTGTPLGDPIEIGALTAVFAERPEPLYVGSVKTNVGHLEMAAGVAGLMKLVLSLQHGQIPPHLHLHTPNPHIDWANAPVQVPTALTPWLAGVDGERIGGVSSFGFSGTNAHVIVAQAPKTDHPFGGLRANRPPSPDAGSQPVRAHHLLTIAAKSEQSLHAYVQRYQELLATQPDLDLGDLCYTSHVGRSHFAQRLALTASSVPALQAQLATYLNGQSNAGISQGTVDPRQPTPKACPGRVAFLFTGQGAQYVNMGRELYTTSPTFRAILDECDALLREELGESLLSVLYPETVDSGQWTVDTRHETRDTRHELRSTQHAARNTLDDTTYTQPALFVLEYALAKLWQSWGVQPDLLIGHSVGEVAAACVAGVFSLADGLKLIAARGRLMGALPQDGEMISLLVSEARVQEVLAPYENEVSIAAVNGPESVVISGKRAAVLAITEQLAAAGVKSRRLTVSHAFHSPLMEPMLADFRRVAESITYHAPKLGLVSNVTGQLAGAEITTADYWVRHVRAAVRFADGIATLQAQGIAIFLEIGPKPVLLGMAGQAVDQMISDPNQASTPHPFTPSPPHPLLLPSLRDGQSDWQQLLNSLGELYVQGVTIDWVGFDQDYHWQKITLPTYPFQPQRFWPDLKPTARNGGAPQHGFAAWLATHTIEQLTDLLMARSAFAPETRATVSQVLTSLEAESRQQQLTAEIEPLLYEVSWAGQNASPIAPPATPGHWLLLTPLTGPAALIGEALAAQLTSLGETVALLPCENSGLAHLDQLAPYLAADALQLRGIVDLSALAAEPLAADAPAATLLARQERNLGGLVQLVQQLTAVGTPAQQPRLWVVTQGAQSLTPSAVVAVDQSPLWGLGRVIALEHGELWGGLIDLDETMTDPATAQNLLAEILQPATAGEEQIAYRQGQRYVARLSPAQPAVINHAALIRPDASYLITGGLGSLGLQTAQWLVAAGAQQLILTGRRGVQSPIQQAILDELRAQGATVQIAQVDVADKGALTQLFAELATLTPPLRGIIHAAGTAGNKPISALEWADFVPLLQPKVVGGWLLHRLSAGFDLDFFLAYSSGAGIWGGKQQGHYGAANHFLDGLMAYRRSQGLPGLSIAWGPWAGPSGLPSMAGPEGQAALLALGVRTLPAPQGLAIQAHLLRTAAVQVTAADIDWTRLKALYELTKPRRFLAQLGDVDPLAGEGTGAAPVAENAVLQEVRALPASQRLERLRRYVQQTLGQVLGMAELPARTVGFAELGMDSLMALELRRQLARDLACALPTTIAFEYPTVEQLAGYLLELVQPQTIAPVVPLVEQGNKAAVTEPIAIISMACRFPGADTPEAFWELLAAGVDLVQEIPLTRWNVDDFYAPQRPTPGKMYTRAAALIEGVDQFDPLFFGIAPREAQGIDPLHRLLLEVSWEVLERAGLAQQALIDSPTGVFVGIGEGEYGALSSMGALTELDTHVATSGGHSAAAGRLAYTLGLQGPTLAVDTACSSSLVALHLACQSLRLGECDLALAGGMNLTLSPVAYIALSQMNALAVDGRCKTFDAAADGYGRGEGGGMVLLKRLSDAQRDGDKVWAVIQGSAVNHDGPSSGLTVPNKRAQEKLLRQALATAQVTPDEVAYIEAHGTGTSLGDPIEMRALGAVFGNEREMPLLVGSVKTNVGHLEAAAGIASIIKTTLALHHGQIPPHLHFQTPNPYIEWDEFALQVPTTLQPWPQPLAGERLVAGVSAFGLSGTNAHIVMASAPREEETRDKETRAQGAPEETRDKARPLYLLPLAAKSGAALAALAAGYAAHLQAHPDLELGDLCYTAAVGRNHFSHRLAIVAATPAELQHKLAAAEPAAGLPDRAQIAFLFTGQGSQYVNMGRALYASEPTFRAAIDRCDELLQAHLGTSLLAVLYPETPDRRQETGDRRHESRITLDDTTYTQPALFALEYALATLWQAWGVQPDLLIGHSVGEVVAACVAGVFSLEDGLKLVAARGRLMGALPQGGAMISLMADEARVAAAIAAYTTNNNTAQVSIAAINGPESVVISGEQTAVLAIAAQLAAEGVKTQQLTVSHAFHSALMEPMLAAFGQVAALITYHKPHLPLVSNVTGQLAGDEVMTPDYWVRHVRAAVRFADGVATLHAQGINIFLEIGPKPTLLGMVEAILDRMTRGQEDRMTVPSHLVTLSPGHLAMLPSLRPSQPDWQPLLTSLGELYAQGIAVDWPAFYKNVTAQKVLLPTYPFQRQSYWVKSPRAAHQTAALRPLIDKLVKLPVNRELLFETTINLERLPFLHDHRVYGTVVAPGAAHLALVLSAAEVTFGEQGYGVHDLIFPQALAIPAAETRTLQLLCKHSAVNDTEQQMDFQLLSFADTPTDTRTVLNLVTTLHASGTVGTARLDATAAPALAALQAQFTERVAFTLYADADQEAAIYLGPAFQWLDEIWRMPTPAADQPFQLLAALRRPAVVESLAGYMIHPGLLDGCFQVAGLAHQWATGATELHLPFALAAGHFAGAASGDSWWCHVELVDTTKYNLRLFDQSGQLLATLDGFEMRAAPPAAIQPARLRTEWLQTLQWTAAPLPSTPATAFLPDCWLVVGATTALQQQLVAQLQGDQRPILTAPADVTLQAVVATVAAAHQNVAVIYLASRDESCADQHVAAHQLCQGLLHLTQALLATELTLQLWIITQDIQPQAALRDHQPLAPAAGALWGLGRTIAQEQPQWRVTCLDLDGSLAGGEHAAQVAAELRFAPPAAGGVTQIAYRQQQRTVAQLLPWQAPPLLDGTQPMRLQLAAYGSLDQLHLVPMQRRLPGPGEIEVEVKAAGLNFRDVLNALGLLQEYYATVLGITQATDVGLGFECAGVVTAVGAGVTSFAVGDRVMGLSVTEGTFAGYITLPATQMVAIPETLRDEDAATIPLTFLTAWYGLVELAKLQPGERVLIHAAAGGVGQAAVQIAQAIGAEVVATVSPSKWAFLKEQGIAHVLNSRTLDFADEVLQLTGGRGVDVVLNSLNGAFIERSLATVGQGGRFVEIGKIGSWSEAEMAQARPDVAYQRFDLGEAMAAQPTLQGRLWQAITAGLQSGALHPLPQITFPAQEAVAAFRYMQQAKQVGKVVLSFAQPEPLTLHADGVYLITGGLGGLGLQVAQQLVADGAGHLVLTGRRGVTTAAQQATLDQLTAAGATIEVVAVDIANQGEVQTLLGRCTAIAPLRGIVHAAGVLDDGVLSAQSPERFANVMRPKVDGAWHLHTLTQGMALDFFVVFSSVASLLGSAGQSNYAAANAFLDSLMQQRRQQGLPGLSINWGPWAAVGMAAHLQGRLQQQGLTLITPQQGQLFFQYLLRQPVAQVGVIPLQRQQPVSQPKPVAIGALLADLAEAERPAYLDRYLRAEIGAVLGLRDETIIDERTRLFDFGMDSLMAVELKNRIEAGLRCSVRSTLLFDYPTIEVLIPYLLNDVLHLSTASAAGAMPPSSNTAHTELEEEIDQFTSDELLSFISQKYEENA